jgi:cyclohexyl-isocyanide hydratase
MSIAFILFDGITALDFVGVYDPIARLRTMGYLPELNWDFCAFERTQIQDSGGLQITTIAPANLEHYDWVIVPGGMGTRALQHDSRFITWLRTAADVPNLASVCTGSLLLGAAGFLRGKRATTHFDEYDTLAAYTDQVRTDRIVEDGNLITAGAVTSSLDLGLYIFRKLAGDEARLAVAERMGYLVR